jgi:hypothetical protein
MTETHGVEDILFKKTQEKRNKMRGKVTKN